MCVAHGQPGPPEFTLGVLSVLSIKFCRTIDIQFPTYIHCILGRYACGAHLIPRDKGGGLVTHRAVGVPLQAPS